MNLSDLTLDALALDLRDPRQQWYEQLDRAVEIAEEISRRTGLTVDIQASDASKWRRELADELVEQRNAARAKLLEGR